MKESKPIGYHKTKIKKKDAKLPFYKIKTNLNNFDFMDIYVADSKGFRWIVVKKSEVEMIK